MSATEPTPGPEDGAAAKGGALKWLPGVVIAGGLTALVAWRLDWAEVAATFRDSQPLYVAPAALIIAAHYGVKGLRWRALIGRVGDDAPGATGGQPVPAGLAIRLTLIGFFMNNFFPARVGELGRPWLLAQKQPVAFSFALATVLGDKLFDLLFTILCLLAASLLVPLPDFARGGIAALCAAGLVGMAVGVGAARWRARTTALLSRLAAPLGDRAAPLLGAADHFLAGLATLADPRRFAATAGWTGLSFLMMGAALVLCMWTVNVPGGLEHALFVMGMLGIGFAIPSPPTHAGTYHFFAAQALLLAGVAADEAAFSFALIAHLLQVLVVSACGLAATAGTDWRVWRRRT